MNYRRIRNCFIGLTLGLAGLVNVYNANSGEIDIGNEKRAERIYEFMRREQNNCWVDTTGFVKLVGSKILLKDGLIYKITAIETLDGSRHLNVEIENRGKNIDDLFIDKNADGCIDNYRKNGVYFLIDNEVDEKYSDALKKILGELNSENSKEKNRIETPELCRGCAFT